MCDNIKCLIFFCILDLGKLFKSWLLQTKGTEFLSVQDLINKGKQVFHHQNISGDVYKQMYFLKIKYHISCLLGGDSTPFIMLKDSTASVLQHYRSWMDCSSPEVLKYLNLASSQEWYDPYTVIVVSFKKHHKIDKDYINLFTRETLKDTIMTYMYGAVYLESLKRFLEQFYFDGSHLALQSGRQLKVDGTYLIDVPYNFNQKVATKAFKNLKDYFKLFYNFLKSELNS